MLPELKVDRVFEDADATGFFAAGFRGDDASLILAVCGSNDPDDFAAGANLAICQYERHRNDLIDYLKDRDWRRITLSGHSLGSALCQYLAYDLVRGRPELSDRLQVYTFNGLGGVWGLARACGSLDPGLLARIPAIHFAHPDDLISRIGGNLAGKVHFLLDDDPDPAPLYVCHAIANFLPAGGRSALHGLVVGSDRTFALSATATRLGPPLRAALRRFFRGDYRSASAILALCCAIPRGERLAVLRFLVSMTALRFFIRRAARMLFRLRGHLGAPAGQRRM
jgi:hypothetical protein